MSLAKLTGSCAIASHSVSDWANCIMRSIAGVISEESEITELGEITAGLKPGRKSASEITICDLTGVGVQDTAIARLAYLRAQEKKLGTAFGD